MPRYFFDLSYNNRSERDRDGTVLADHEAARREAIGTLPEIAADELLTGESHRFAAVVRDDAGCLIYRAELLLTGQWLTMP